LAALSEYVGVALVFESERAKALAVSMVAWAESKISVRTQLYEWERGIHVWINRTF
jgi:hypothetical protein